MDEAEIVDRLNAAYFSDDPHEIATLEALRPVLTAAKRFVDVGASLGQYTRLANTVMRNGQITSIEADPLRARVLGDNCRDWSGNNRLEVIHAACGDQSGEVSFCVTHSDVSGGLWEHATPAGREVEWTRVTVPMITLDSLPGPPPDLVKIDVEGAEFRVLQGAVGLLSAGVSAFIVELHGWGDPTTGHTSQDVLQLMEAHGYHSWDFFGSRFFAKRGVLGPLALGVSVLEGLDRRWVQHKRRMRRLLGRP